MAELLVFIGNNTHADPVKDRHCWKRGMPISVFDDGHIWGREESKQAWIAEGRTAASWPNQGKLAIVKIPGVPASKALALIAPQMEDDDGVQQFDARTAKPIIYRRRRWRLLVDSISSMVRNQLLAAGEVSVTVAQIRNFLQRVRDGAVYTGLD